MELGLYVAVADLSKSKQFYATLFDTKPYVENDNFVGFELAGGRFGLMKAAAYAHPLKQGNNTVPNIRVADIGATYQLVKSLDPPMVQESITDLGAMKLFIFMDPDNNVIEFHSLSKG